jgi:hypothetical protein
VNQDLRKLLERNYGLSRNASDFDAQEFYARLSTETKSRIARELAEAEIRETRLPGGFDGLTTRETADTNTRDLTIRDFTVRAESVNDESRSVEAVLVTDDPVTVYDYRLGELIDEVLRMDGAEIPEQVPMLANHSRWSLDDVFGSVREIKFGNHDAKGRLYFAEGDVDAERAWQKVRGGHIRDVSAGYRAVKYTDVRPGQTAIVGGRSYTARGRTLRITTRWQLKEVSLVPIGADARSKIRTDQPIEEFLMNPKLRKYLESIGLRADATDAEALTFLAGLEGAQRQQADTLKDGENQRSDPPATPPADPPETNRTGAQPPPLPNVEDAVRQAVDAERRAERERVRLITELAGEDVSDELRQQAILDGWDVNRASTEFLRYVRENRAPERDLIGGAPATHVRGRETDVNARALACAMLIQNGSDPTQCREYDAIGEQYGRQFAEQDADRGDRLRGLSAPDLFRECIRCDTNRHFSTIDEALSFMRREREMGRAGVSGGTLSYVFGTNIYAKLSEGWMEVADSTAGWCEEEDVPNFLQQEDITLNLNGEPEQHGRGDTAADVTFSDKHETYRAYRFTRKVTFDEMDIINDRLGALMRIPQMMGQAFRRMRPNMVYSVLLLNPKLVADSKAVFHADHGNLGTAVLGANGLSAALTAIASQRSENGRDVLDIQGRYLIVPAALSWTAAQLLNGVALAKTHATKSDPDYIPVNPVGPSVIKQVIGDNLTLVTDDRIGATGVWNPMTKAMVTGSATNWFVTAGPRRGVRVLYRRGTNRQPAVRNFTLDRGQWGFGVDMVMDMGRAPMDYRGLYKSTGTV